MAVILDQSGAPILDEADNDLLDQAGLTTVSTVCTSSWDVLVDVSVNKTSAWNVGKGYQQTMIQMAAVPWISMYPS